MANLPQVWVTGKQWDLETASHSVTKGIHVEAGSPVGSPQAEVSAGMYVDGPGEGIPCYRFFSSKPCSLKTRLIFTANHFLHFPSFLFFSPLLFNNSFPMPYWSNCTKIKFKNKNMRAQHGGGHEAGHPALDMVRKVDHREIFERHETWRMHRVHCSDQILCKIIACPPKPQWRILWFVWIVQVPA